MNNTHAFSMIFDGWPVVYQPASPASLHLLFVLENLPAAVHPIVALPGSPPDWLPENATPSLYPTPNTPWGRLRWQQRTLATLAEPFGANGIFLTRATPGLVSAPRTWASPVDFPCQPESPATPFADRLAISLAQGGLQRLKALAWPADLPAPQTAAPLAAIPPAVSAAFSPPGTFANPPTSFPEGYILYHGPADLYTLTLALHAWTWPSGPIGQDYPLVMLGLPPQAQTAARALCAELDIEETVLFMDAPPPTGLPAVYRGAAAVFHPAETNPWSGPVRHALACGRPLISIETPLNAALVGDAAYLRPAGDSKALGAALISTIVREDVGEQLSRAAIARSAAWDIAGFRRGLAALLLGSG